jgi:hypothetical protein|tara:strand:+ start:8248 stop:8484 length:237 start_codon:yes stop_codon:yes gene_type:complete
MAKASKAKAPVKRVRARKKDGSFQKDDPSTADVNEAFIEVFSVSATGESPKAKEKPKLNPAAPQRTRTVNEFGDIVKL